jgi:hypothetical protein
MSTSFRECAIVQALGRRLAIAEARVRAHASQCRIYGGQTDIGTGIPPSNSALSGHDYHQRAPNSFTDLSPQIYNLSN